MHATIIASIRQRLGSELRQRRINVEANRVILVRAKHRYDSAIIAMRWRNNVGANWDTRVRAKHCSNPTITALSRV